MKTCSKCKEEKELSEFHKNSLKKDGYNSYCKSCMRTLQNQNQHLYRQRQKRNTKKYIERNKEFVNRYKSLCGCKICGEKRSWILDFHHLEDKDENVSRLVIDCTAINKLKIEIKKCIVLCSNCHRNLHYLNSQALVV